MAALIYSECVYMFSEIEKSESNRMGPLPTLYDENGKFVPTVNAWFFDLVATKKLKDLSSYSKAMLKYWSFLEASSLMWDEFPPSKRMKPTYLFKFHLLSEIQERRIAHSTANHYLKHVVQFYLWAIKEAELIIADERRVPFSIEQVTVGKQGGLDYFRPRFVVNTSDLKIRVPQKSQNTLNPLSYNSFELFVKSLERQSIEFQLICSLAVLSGLRAAEACSFTLEALHTAKPTTEDSSHFEVTIGPHTGVATKFDKQRVVEVSASLISRLKNYSISERRLIRANRLKVKAQFEPLFISQFGNQISERTLSARWSEFRAEIKKLDQEFNHSFHDLRSTYATYTLYDLLSAGIKTGEALDCLMMWMGHKDENTTMKYIKFLNRKSAILNKIALLDQIMHKAIESTQ